MSGATRDRWLLLGWLISVVAITMLHDLGLLVPLMVGLLLMHGRQAGHALWRALAAVAVVNLAVSIGFVVVSIHEQRPWIEALLRLNLRVLSLALLTLWVIPRVRIERALQGLGGLPFLATLVQGQIRTLGRVVADCRMALDSRSALRLRWRDRMRGADRQLGAVLCKAELQSEALSQGMESRGYFDARG